MPNFQIATGFNERLGYTAAVPFSPPLASYYLMSATGAPVDATFIYFDADGKALSSDSATIAAGAGGVVLSTISTIPSGAVGALMSISGNVWMSTKAFTIATDDWYWSVETADSIPLGIVPSNIGTSASGTSTTGGGVSIELWRYQLYGPGGGMPTATVQFLDSMGKLLSEGVLAGMGTADTICECAINNSLAYDPFGSCVVLNVSGNVYYNTGATSKFVKSANLPTTSSDTLKAGMILGEQKAAANQGVSALSVQNTSGVNVPVQLETDGGMPVHITNTDGKTAKDLFETAAAFTITLASLPTQESRVSTQIDLTDANGVAAERLALFCAVKLGTVDIGDSVEFYWLRGDENVAPFLNAGLAATDTNYSAANTLLMRAALMPYKIGRVFANATATPVVYFSTIIDHPGPRGSLYIINSSKATTSATAGDHYCRYIPLSTTVV